MAPLGFDRDRILALLRVVGERLDGEWLLIGGSAAAAWFSPSRTTEDIDLIGLAGTQAERFALMNLAAEQLLPIEAVNSAADFFVRRIEGWRERIVELHRGSRAVVFRPDPTLFLLLKIDRLSDVDLTDCIALVDHCALHGETIDVARVRAALDALQPTDDEHLEKRRARLRDRFG